jgi:hypothetical protein
MWLKARWPWVATVVYLGVLLVSRLSVGGDLAYFLQHKPLNEVGDTLAGVFAPLAFLWLILGYLMQNQELKLQGRQLNLQLREIELQRQEMEKSNDTLIKQQQALDKQTQLLLSQNRAYFVHQGGRRSSNIFNYRFYNRGNTAINLCIKANGVEVKTSPITLLTKNGEFVVEFDGNEIPSQIQVFFDDFGGNQWQQTFTRKGEGQEATYTSTPPQLVSP